MTNAPTNRIQVGNISVSVWNNESKTKEGKEFTFTTFTLQRGYQKDGQWENTNILRKADLPKAILALEEAFKMSVMKGEEE